MGRLGKVRDRLRGKRSSAADTDDPPCIPCGQSKGVRQFAITAPPELAVEDTDVPALAPHVVDTVIDNQVVVLRSDTSMTNVLNASAALIWLSVDGVKSVGDIVDELEHDTGAPREVLATDVRDALRRFVGSGILTFDNKDTDETTGNPASTASASADRWHAVVERRLDAVEWTTTFGPGRAAGVDLLVRTNVPEFDDDLRAALGSFPPSPGPATTTMSILDTGEGPRRYRVYLDGRRTWSAAEPDSLLPYALTMLNQHVIDHTRGHLMLHAGAVERDGHVAVIAGDSGRGKSTLTAALVADGFGYLTDEMVAIDPATLEVLPYPKSIDLDRGSLELLDLDPHNPPGPDETRAKHRIGPLSIGSVSGGGKLALLVLLVGDEDTSAEDLGTSPTVSTLIDLLGATFRSSFDDPGTLDALARLVDEVPPVRLQRAPIRQLVTSVRAAIGGA